MTLPTALAKTLTLTAGLFALTAFASAARADGDDPPSCENNPGYSQLASKDISNTYCRATHGNECIARGSATVSINVYTCTYNNFDGCNIYVGSYTEECGEEYGECGC